MFFIFLIFLIQGVSAVCYTLFPAFPPDKLFDPVDLQCSPIFCTENFNEVGITDKMKDDGWCAHSTISSCECKNGFAQPYCDKDYNVIVSYFFKNKREVYDSTSHAPPCPTISCGACGRYNSEKKECECEITDPAGDNNCFVCRKNQATGFCYNDIDKTGKVGICQECDEKGNIVYVKDGSVWNNYCYCDENGNCKGLVGVYDKKIDPRCGDCGFLDISKLENPLLEDEGTCISSGHYSCYECICKDKKLKELVQGEKACEYKPFSGGTPVSGYLGISGNCRICTQTGEAENAPKETPCYPSEKDFEHGEKTGICFEDGRCIFKTESDSEPFLGKDCLGGDGFYKKMNNKLECVLKTCNNIYESGKNVECGKNEKEAKKYGCCLTNECNQGKKGKGVCCDESTTRIKDSVEGNDIAWCNPKNCPYEKTQGIIDNKIKLEMCCDKGESAETYFATKKLGLAGVHTFYQGVCVVDCKNGLSKITDNKGKPIKFSDGNEKCCAEGKKFVFLKKDFNTGMCVPKECRKDETMCKGKPGNLEKAALCCSQGTACFWHPNGAPMCYILDREKLPKTEFKIEGTKIMMNLPHGSVYLIRNNADELNGKAYKINFVNFVKGSTLTINSNENFNQDSEVYIYPDYFINSNCEISELDSKEMKVSEGGTKIDLGEVILDVPKPQNNYEIGFPASLSVLSLKCRNLDNQFQDFSFGEEETSEQETEKTKKCFIATTVYGDENAPQVETLREIRDEVLDKSFLGRKVVSFYYSGAGEKTAEFIEEKTPFLIPVIRRGLDIVVERYEKN